MCRSGQADHNQRARYSYSCCYSVPGVVWPRDCTHLLASVSENSSSTSTVQLCASRSCTHANGTTAPQLSAFPSRSLQGRPCHCTKLLVRYPCMDTRDYYAAHGCLQAETLRAYSWTGPRLRGLASLLGCLCTCPARYSCRMKVSEMSICGKQSGG